MKRAALALSVLLGCTRAPPEPCRYTLSATSLSLTPNLDDDDHDGRRDGLGDVIAPEDNDLETLRLESSCPEADPSFSVHLEPPEARDEIRVFDAAGRLVAGQDKRGTVSLRQTPLFLDAVQGRHGGFDGAASLVLEAPGVPPLTVALEVRPVVFPDVRSSIEKLHSVELVDPDFGPNTAFLAGLSPALSGVPLALAKQADTQSDRWIQDAFEIGALGGEGPAMRVWVKLDRAGPDQGLFEWADRHALQAGVGVVYVGASGGTPLSGGGNIDVLPIGPAGRLLIGGDLGLGGLDGPLPEPRRMAPTEQAWLSAQRVQGPIIEVDTAWLATGHLDELAQPMWVEGSTLVMVTALPSLGLALLDALPPATRVGARTAAAWRSDRRFRGWQEAATRRIRGLQAALSAAAAPLKLRFIELPVLFELNAQRLATAILPSAANLVVLGKTAVVGAQGVNSFSEEVARRLSAVGLEVRAVDVSAYHPHGGSVHCAILAERALTPSKAR